MAASTGRGGLRLAGDVGGTKTALALVSPSRGPHRPVATATFASRDYPGLEAIVRAFLSGPERAAAGGRVERAVFGVPGPVVAGRAAVTNLPWVLEERRLARALRLRSVRLLNDLAAAAQAVPVLRRRDLRTLNRGVPQRGGTIGVIAPGTGLGEAFLVWDGAGYRACPSEGGHADFAPRTPLERDLLAFVGRDTGHVSFERVCSGIGIPNLYAFLRARGRHREPAWLGRAIDGAEDPAREIVAAATTHAPRAAIAAATLRLFVSILGAEAGNLALKVLATGGVYVGGGIPPRILPYLGGGAFMAAFARKGRLSDLLRRVPVHVIVHPGTALLGASSAAL